MEDTIDISGIDRAELLQALVNGTRSIGLGVLHDNGKLSLEDAQKALAGADERKRNGAACFDYVAGRPIKVAFTDDGQLLRANLYDRDSYDGNCQRVVDELRAG